MDGTISDRWTWLKLPNITLPVFVRRTHRIFGALWILSVALAFAVDAAGGELPGPSLPALSLIASVITGGYLLLRPWVRRDRTLSNRLKRLKNWNVTLPVFIRRFHRIVAALWVLFLAIGLSIDAAGGPESPIIIIPVVVLLILVTITGGYMLLRPWVNRFRTR